MIFSLIFRVQDKIETFVTHARNEKTLHKAIHTPFETDKIAKHSLVKKSFKHVFIMYMSARSCINIYPVFYASNSILRLNFIYMGNPKGNGYLTEP